jgi:hypothetical protein
MGSRNGNFGRSASRISDRLRLYINTSLHWPSFIFSAFSEKEAAQELLF